MGMRTTRKMTRRKMGPAKATKMTRMTTRMTKMMRSTATRRSRATWRGRRQVCLPPALLPTLGTTTCSYFSPDSTSTSQQAKSRFSIQTTTPPHLTRRSLFLPAYTSPPANLSIEAIVAIPLPSAVHSIASTACSSYLLAGSQDGYVRCYHFWASVNGGQLMTAQQRSAVGLGEGVAKAGVARGWWAVEVDGVRDGVVGRKMEPVYSLACEGDGLWALAGTQVRACSLTPS